MDTRRCARIFRRFRKLRPEPTTELRYRNAFELLVAVILSAQCTDVAVNKATRKLFARARTPKSILALGVAGLKPYIRSIGLHNSKAANIIATCRTLIEQHGGRVPRTREALQALPGVGRKTANVILNTAFGEPVIAVDTHIFRVSNRIGIAPGRTVREVEDGLMRRVPRAFLKDAHHWLILHGRYTCTARNPKCPECGISDLCEWPGRMKKLQ
ncbi:MAG: endonuclease III [Gammaproteobacteria bacterium]|nr:endonuclease III [Gammaproteobacteria bacterium]